MAKTANDDIELGMGFAMSPMYVSPGLLAIRARKKETLCTGTRNQTLSVVLHFGAG